jgi:hypothetical protein
MEKLLKITKKNYYAKFFIISQIFFKLESDLCKFYINEINILEFIINFLIW